MNRADNKVSATERTHLKKTPGILEACQPQFVYHCHVGREMWKRCLPYYGDTQQAFFSSKTPGQGTQIKGKYPIQVLTKKKRFPGGSTSLRVCATPPRHGPLRLREDVLWAGWRNPPCLCLRQIRPTLSRLRRRMCAN